MSESEIQTLCEAYIGRKFDEDDSYALRTFLHDLLKQKIKRPISEHSSVAHSVVERKEKRVIETEVVPSPLVSQDKPIFKKTKAFVEAVATSTIEKTTEVDVGPSPRVADRKETFIKATSQAGLSPRKIDNLEDVPSGPGVKDRLGNYLQETEKSKATSEVDERVAEAKASSSVKERLGLYKQTVESSGVVGGGASERVAEISGSPSVKDRYRPEEAAAAAKTQERLEEVKGAAGVKDRLGAWSKMESNPSVSVPVAAEKPAETVAGTPGVKDRMGQWGKAATAAEETAGRKKPIDLKDLPGYENYETK